MENLTKIINGLYLYYRFDKSPEPEQIKAMFSQVSFIPDVAGDWISSKIKDDKDNLPRNIGKVFKEYWAEYQHAHPQKTLKPVQTKCEECHGIGLIWYLFQKNDREYESFILCDKCENWKLHFTSSQNMPFGNLQNLIHSGYEIARVSSGYNLRGFKQNRGIVKRVAESCGIEDENISEKIAQLNKQVEQIRMDDNVPF